MVTFLAYTCKTCLSLQSGDKSLSLSSSIHGSPMTTPSSSHSSLPREPTTKYLIPQMESTPQMNGHQQDGKCGIKLSLLEIHFFIT